jgi:two-component system, LytTR family, response regulator
MPPLRAYLVDDEPLALKRLARLLAGRPDVTVLGSTTDPETALSYLQANHADVLFLDIEMPGLSGFDLLERLERQPFVVFTTAYDHYALRAFEVNSVDYLLKPIGGPQLDRALAKLGAMRGSGGELAPAGLAVTDLGALLRDLAGRLREGRPAFAQRIASRVGERIQLISVRAVSHFRAESRLTFAVLEDRQHVVDDTLSALEAKLDPERFVRIHRATIVNLDWVAELHGCFGGGVVARLKDARRTELSVARDRVSTLKLRLGL